MGGLGGWGLVGMVHKSLKSDSPLGYYTHSWSGHHVKSLSVGNFDSWAVQELTHVTARATAHFPMVPPPPPPPPSVSWWHGRHR